MTRPVKKIIIHRGTKGAEQARGQAYMALAAIRLDKEVLGKKWTRRGQLRKAAGMLFIQSREAYAAGFDDDAKHIARAARAMAEAAA